MANVRADASAFMWRTISSEHWFFVAARCLGPSRALLPSAVVATSRPIYVDRPTRVQFKARIKDGTERNIKAATADGDVRPSGEQRRAYQRNACEWGDGFIFGLATRTAEISPETQADSVARVPCRQARRRRQRNRPSTTTRHL